MDFLLLTKDFQKTSKDQSSWWHSPTNLLSWRICSPIRSSLCLICLSIRLTMLTTFLCSTIKQPLAETLALSWETSWIMQEFSSTTKSGEFELLLMFDIRYNFNRFEKWLSVHRSLFFCLRRLVFTMVTGNVPENCKTCKHRNYAKQFNFDAGRLLT